MRTFCDLAVLLSCIMWNIRTIGKSGHLYLYSDNKCSCTNKVQLSIFFHCWMYLFCLFICCSHSRIFFFTYIEISAVEAPLCMTPKVNTAWRCFIMPRDLHLYVNLFFFKVNKYFPLKPWVWWGNIIDICTSFDCWFAFCSHNLDFI